MADSRLGWGQRLSKYMLLAAGIHVGELRPVPSNMSLRSRGFGSRGRGGKINDAQSGQDIHGSSYYSIAWEVFLFLPIILATPSSL